MEKYRHTFFELVLILSTVLVFRSLWELMDLVPLLNENYMHMVMLVVGIVLTIFTVNKLTHAD